MLPEFDAAKALLTNTDWMFHVKHTIKWNNMPHFWWITMKRSI